MKPKALEREEAALKLREAFGRAQRQRRPANTLVRLGQLLSQSSLLGPEVFEVLLWGIAQSPALRDTLRKAPPPKAADVARFLGYVPEVAFVLGESRKGKALLGEARQEDVRTKPPAPQAPPAEYDVLADLLQLGNVFLGYRHRLEYLERRLALLEREMSPKATRDGQDG